MNCPRGCGTELLERERDGVTVDAWPECRGLWLDRGELERLVSRARAEFDDDPHRKGRRGERYDAYRDRSKPRKKRRWFESLTDVFGD